MPESCARLDARPAQRGAHADRALVVEHRKAHGNEFALEVGQIVGRDAGRRYALVDRVAAPEIAEFNHGTLPYT